MRESDDTRPGFSMKQIQTKTKLTSSSVALAAWKNVECQWKTIFKILFNWLKKNQIRFVFIAASFFLFLCCRGEIELFCRCFNCALMVDSFLYWTLIVAFFVYFLYFFQSLLIGLLFTRKTRRPPIEKEDIWYLINYGFFCYRFRFAIWFAAAAAAIKEIFCISFAAVLFCCWCYFTFSYCCMEEQLWSCLTETRFNATYLKQLFFSRYSLYTNQYMTLNDVVGKDSQAFPSMTFRNDIVAVFLFLIRI